MYSKWRRRWDNKKKFCSDGACGLPAFAVGRPPKINARVRRHVCRPLVDVPMCDSVFQLNLTVIIIIITTVQYQVGHTYILWTWHHRPTNAHLYPVASSDRRNACHRGRGRGAPWEKRSPNCWHALLHALVSSSLTSAPPPAVRRRAFPHSANDTDLENSVFLD